jgi:hypothetical protein
MYVHNYITMTIMIDLVAAPGGRDMTKKPTIKELEEILDSEEDTPIEILPNGEIRAQGRGASEIGGQKPLTLREDLGGEYAEPAQWS